MEFAYDLLTNYGKSARTTRLVNATRTIVVPIVNVDGFNVSREAPDDSAASRRSTTSEAQELPHPTGSTPAPYTTAPATINPAGACAASTRTATTAASGAARARASTRSDDTYRGDGAVLRARDAEHPELSTRQVTNLITNHTYSNLVLRPPGVARTGSPVDEPLYRALGARHGRPQRLREHPELRALRHDGRDRGLDVLDRRAAAASRSRSARGVPPAVRDRRRGRVPRPRRRPRARARAATARRTTGCSRRRPTPALHSRDHGQGAEGLDAHDLRKEFQTETSPVLANDGGTGHRRRDRSTDTLESSYRCRPAARFDVAREPVDAAVRGRPPGRDPPGRRRPTFALANPAGQPAENAGDPPRTRTRRSRSRCRRPAGEATTTAA